MSSCNVVVDVTHAGHDGGRGGGRAAAREDGHCGGAAGHGAHHAHAARRPARLAGVLLLKLSETSILVISKHGLNYFFLLSKAKAVPERGDFDYKHSL